MEICFQILIISVLYVMFGLGTVATFRMGWDYFSNPVPNPALTTTSQLSLACSGDAAQC